MTAQFLEACPFLRDRLTWELQDGPVVVMAGAARLARNGSLSEAELDQLFTYWNTLAEAGDAQALDVLGTGALELFNDDAGSQRLARRRLTGRALQMLDALRAGWGQPDYGDAI